MQLALRQAYEWGGLGQSGETDVEGGALPGGTVETGGGSGESWIGTVTSGDPFPVFGSPADCADLSLWSSVQARDLACARTIFAGPNITPGPELTPDELAAEQARARAWLSTLNLPSTLAAGAKVALTAAQIAAGLHAGTVKASSTCPSGYLISGTGNCVTSSGAGGQILSGVSNQALIIGGIVVFALFMMGKRR